MSAWWRNKHRRDMRLPGVLWALGWPFAVIGLSAAVGFVGRAAGWW